MFRSPISWLTAVLFLVVVAVAPVGGDPLRFRFQEGDQYRYTGTSTQRVTVDGAFLQDSELSYRIAFRVVRVDADGTGWLDGAITYMTARVGSSGAAVTQEYHTEYRMDPRGVALVPEGQVMPVVRSVPTLPLGEVVPGEVWTAPGEEVHDLRDDFGVDRLLRVPFVASYADGGTVVRDGVEVRVIRSTYGLRTSTGFRSGRRGLYPVQLAGRSDQTHYFNPAAGREEGYEESYRLALTLNTGQVVVYEGVGRSDLIEARPMDRPALAAEVRQALAADGLGEVEVREAEAGVVLNLDLIQFPADSSLLLPGERAKLERLGAILAKYPDRDLLIEGHTADAPSPVDPQKLSEDRARVVGEALIARGVRGADQILYRGWGPSRPLDTNATAEGRARNRRVEITLLEN